MTRPTQAGRARLTEEERPIELSDQRVTYLADRWTKCHRHHSTSHTPQCDATTLARAIESIALARERTARASAAADALAEAERRIEALASTWVRDEDEGIEHVVSCHDYTCKTCVVIACATDLRILRAELGGDHD